MLLPLNAYAFLTLLSLAFAGTYANSIGFTLFATLGAAAIAVATGMLSPVGLVSAMVLVGLCYLLFSESGKAQLEKHNKFIGVALHVVFILTAAAFLAHLAPGFERWVVLPHTMLSPQSPPLDVAFYFDKPLFALVALAFGWRALSPGTMTASSWKITAASAAALYPAVFAFALAVGLVQLDVKVPAFLPVWVIMNLVLNTIAEEVFFRGYVQQRLTSHVGPYASLVLTSLLFGAAHLGAGPLFALAALLAGVGYGWVYLRTRSLIASSLIHVGLNAVHFVFFTYPARL